MVSTTTRPFTMARMRRGTGAVWFTGGSGGG